MNFVRNVLAFVVLACLSLSAQQITGNIRGNNHRPKVVLSFCDAAVTTLQAETGLSRSADYQSQRQLRSSGTPGRTLPRLQVGAKGFQGVRAGWHHAQRERDSFGFATSRGRIGKAGDSGESRCRAD